MGCMSCHRFTPRAAASSHASPFGAGRRMYLGGLALMMLGVSCGIQAVRGEQSGQVARINDQVRVAWKSRGLKPAEEAPDGIWARRLYLDLIGRVPTLAELQAYLQTPARSRRTWLVDELLSSKRYENERVENWSTIWANRLIGRTGGMGNNALANREGLLVYLREAIRAQRPYDRMIMELLASDGASVPGQPEFQGAVNYLLAKLQDGTEAATAHVARLCLGRQVQCTQCHNHPFNDWKQNQFWELNSFLRQTVALRRFVPDTNNIRFVELTDQDFAGEGGTPDQAEIYYELRNGELRSAYPRFIDGQMIDPNGRLSEVHRRRELARLIVASPFLAEAQVNREWSHFLGYGFTKPMDDMGPHNLPSHPELLDFLANEFREAGYDTRKLMRWIVLSEPYQLASTVRPSNESDDPRANREAWFSRFYARQMRAEELYRSLLVATRADASMSSSEATRAQQRWLRQFTQAFGDDEGTESTTFDGTIPQTLMLFNGDLIKKAVAGGAGTVLGDVARSGNPVTNQIQDLYLAAMARRPTRSELNKMLALFRQYPNQEVTVLQDVWWALLNSNEFIMNH